jgi:hypothetical protein
LSLFALGRGWEGDDAADAWVQPLHDALDHSAFACGMAPFENYNDLCLSVLDPVLQLDELGLQRKKMLEVCARSIGGDCPCKSFGFLPTAPARTIRVQGSRPARRPTPPEVNHRCSNSCSSLTPQTARRMDDLARHHNVRVTLLR